MKRILLSLMIAAGSLGFVAQAGTPVAKTSLPKAAQTFLSKYFPNDNIRKAEKDNGYHGLEYEVDLTSGAEVDFRENGEWKEVKAARGHAVPAGVVPAAIVKYVTANFKGQKIVEVSRKRGGYEVELSNGTELRLTEDAKQMPARQGGHKRH